MMYIHTQLRPAPCHLWGSDLAKTISPEPETIIREFRELPETMIRECRELPETIIREFRELPETRINVSGSGNYCLLGGGLFTF